MKHKKSYDLESKLIAKEADDFERYKAFKKLTESLEVDVDNLKDHIRNWGIHSDTCTFFALNEVCSNCRCGRQLKP